MVKGIGREMTHFVGRWWREQAETYNAKVKEQYQKDKQEAERAKAEGKKVEVEKPDMANPFPSAETFSNINLHLEISASANEQIELYTRCWADSSRVVIDLGDRTGRVVLVTADVANPYRVIDPRENNGDLPWFRRSATMGAQVEPVRAGSVDVLAMLERLRGILGYEGESRVWLLTLGWILGGHCSDVDRPGIWMTGPTGAGKTTRVKMAVNLIDPVRELGGDPDVRRDPRNARTRAMNRFVFSMDNLDNVTRESKHSAPVTIGW